MRLATAVTGMLLAVAVATSQVRAQQTGLVLRDLSAKTAEDASPFSPLRGELPAELQEVQRLEQNADFTNARQQATAYLADHESSAEAHELLAYALLRLNDPRQALAEFQRSAQIATPSATLLLHVGQAYVFLKQNTEADRWTLRAVETDPADADAWYGLGRIRYTEERFADARQCFERVLKLSPRAAKAEDNLGLTFEALNDPKAAEAAYRRAILLGQEETVPPHSEQPYLNLGALLLRQGRPDEAGAMLVRADAIAPGNPRVEEQLGQLAMREGKWTAAEKAFAQALANEPDNAALHYLRGQALRHAGLEAEAKAEFARSAKLRASTSVASAP